MIRDTPAGDAEDRADDEPIADGTDESEDEDYGAETAGFQLDSDAELAEENRLYAVRGQLRFGRGSVPMFFARMRRVLKSLGIKYELLPAKTERFGTPACFDSNRQYREWLAQASATEVKLRADMPAEPNYCVDCTACFAKTMREQGRCGFPGVKFVKRRYLEEHETIGVTQRPLSAPLGFVFFRKLLVSDTALDAETHKSASVIRRRTITRRKFDEHA